MVLELKEKAGKKYLLALNGERYGRCYPKDLRTLGFDAFSEGQITEITEEALVEFEYTVFLPRAKKRALLLLGKKEYTKCEMEKKLDTDGYPEAVVSKVLDWLAELRYVEDRSYAERYALYLLPRCSEREIMQKMQLKGFEKELIKVALESAKESYRSEHEIEGGMDGLPEFDAIRTYLRKKGYKPENIEEEKKKKIVMALYRKGFSLSDIKAVIGAFETDSEW